MVRFTSACLFIGMIVCMLPCDGAVRQLYNDAYESGDEANYQAGFVASEIMAASFSVDPEEYPFDLLSVQVLVGDGTPGGTTPGTFILHIWEDTGGEAPGAELVDPFSVPVTSGVMNDISLAGLGVPSITGGAVRIGLEFIQNPPPSFFTDADNFITQYVNTLYSVDFGWHYAEFYGLTGDWILRVTVNTSEPAATVTPTGTPSTPTPDFTATPYPTYTPQPTYTPRPTATPYPTYTAPPTVTPPPTYTPPPTATASAAGTQLQLWMPSHRFTPGLPFLVNAIITNPGSTLDNTQFMCLLAVGNSLWFYPQWKTAFSTEPRTVPPGETIIEVIPEFFWPSGAGTLDNVMFIAALWDENVRELLAPADIWIWGFSE